MMQASTQRSQMAQDAAIEGEQQAAEEGNA